MRKSMICAMAAILIISATAAFGAVKEGSFSVSPLVGGYSFDDDHHLDSTLVLGLRAGYNFTKNLGVEALYDFATKANASDAGPDRSLQRIGGQALYHFFPDNAFVPYLAAGYSGLHLQDTGVTRGAFDYGVGAKYFLTDNFALRGDIRQILYSVDSYHYNDIEYTFGAYFQFGAAAPAVKAIEPAPMPEPAKVVPAPAPVPVPPADSDHDGVIDTLDKCPGTPAGVVVDSNGCPIDSDKDGVADYLDKCPNTPAGAPVDSNGCPLDSDKDGVADYLDKCPNTPAGTVVNASGCPLEAAKKYCDKPTVIPILFDFGKSDIKAKYHDELDKVGNFLKEFPKSKGTIEGHTDSIGNPKSNMKLSVARAEKVAGYLNKKFGIDAGRITAKGYGESKPVASNKNAAGRAENRRIETAFSCE
jgi:OmpA-OmpF porin, OOP family